MRNEAMRTSPRPHHVLTYRPGSDNVCPCCAKSNWIVGRATAECGFCATALPIAAPFWTTIALRAA